MKPTQKDDNPISIFISGLLPLFCQLLSFTDNEPTCNTRASKSNLFKLKIGTYFDHKRMYRPLPRTNLYLLACIVYHTFVCEVGQVKHRSLYNHDTDKDARFFYTQPNTLYLKRKSRQIQFSKQIYFNPFYQVFISTNSNKQCEIRQSAFLETHVVFAVFKRKNKPFRDLI